MKMKEIMELSTDELLTKRRDLRQESLHLRLQQQSGQLEQPSRRRHDRRAQRARRNQLGADLGGHDLGRLLAYVRDHDERYAVLLGLQRHRLYRRRHDDRSPGAGAGRHVDGMDDGQRRSHAHVRHSGRRHAVVLGPR